MYAVFNKESACCNTVLSLVEKYSTTSLQQKRPDLTAYTTCSTIIIKAKLAVINTGLHKTESVCMYQPFNDERD